MKLLMAFLWLMVVPAGTGMLLVRRTREKNTLGNAWIFGWLVMFTVFQALVLPMIYQKARLDTLIWIWAAVMILLTLLGVVMNIKNFPSMVISYFTGRKNISAAFFLACIIIGIQIFISVFYTHLDADDAMYVGAATTAFQTNTIMEINPYTGAPYTKLPDRYMFSPFPVFLAVISRLLSIHPSVVAHTVFAALFLVLAYTVYYQLGKCLFVKEKKAPGLFLLFLALIQMFSYYSVYTPETFLMVRIWQGKAVLAAILLPCIWYVAMELMKHKTKGFSWLTLFCLMASCTMVSTMGVLLPVIELAVLTFLLGVLEKRWDFVGKAVICCIPNCLVGGLYFIAKFLV